MYGGRFYCSYQLRFSDTRGEQIDYLSPHTFSLSRDGWGHDNDDNKRHQQRKDFTWVEAARGAVYYEHV